jgi:multiple sugar transport system substrate-binding protein
VSAGGNHAKAGGGTAGEKTKVLLWHYFSNVSHSVFEELVTQYNARSDAPLSIEFQYLPRNELIKRYTLGVVSNDLPEIGMIDNPDSASFAAMGMWLDTTGKMKSLPNQAEIEQQEFGFQIPYFFQQTPYPLRPLGREITALSIRLSSLPRS